MGYDLIRAKLARGETIILDGGTGTDIQRRGAAMSGDTWCADANLTSPDIVRDVHKDYVACGADIITANPFATSPLLFSHIGRAADVNRIDAIAVKLAQEAVAGTNVCVAGSMSTMRPMQTGSDRNNLAHEWSEADARALFRMKANGLKAAGVDLIMMEMMRDTDYSLWASEAAMETGLPVWIGISVERADGELKGFGRNDQRLADVAPALAALEPAAMSIMHTSPNETDEALTMLRQYYAGPIGAYPECGYFKAPNWVFVDTIAPDDLAAKCRDWQALGATFFGGCCGIGPEHIGCLHGPGH